MPKLDRAFLDNVPPTTRRVEYADDELEGLRLRVAPSGDRSWSVLARLPTGHRKRLTIGSAAVISPRQARERGRQLQAQARVGKLEPKLTSTGTTVGSLVVDYCSSPDWLRLSPATRKTWRIYFERYILPAFGKRAPESITRAEVRAWAGRIAAKTPTTGTRCLETLRRVFNWAIDGELVKTANPCQRLPKPAPEKRRDRVYTDDELKRVLAASVGTEVELLLRLVTLTLTRSGETRALKLGWFNAERTLLTLPGEFTKNGEAHPVPLSTDAQALLFGLQTPDAPATKPSPDMLAAAAGKARGLKREACPLFPAATREGYMDDPHTVMKAVGKAAGVPDLRLHDIRRTGASRLEELGVESDTIEAALGHIRPSLHRTYRPAFPLAKVRDALDRLALHYRERLGWVWWEPTESERDRLEKLLEML